MTRLKDVQERVGLILITEAEIHRIEELWAEEIADLALLDAGVEDMNQNIDMELLRKVIIQSGIDMPVEETAQLFMISFLRS